MITTLTVTVGFNGVEAYRVGPCENRSALVQGRDEQEHCKGRTAHCADARDRDGAAGLVGRHDLSLCYDGKPRPRTRGRGASISMPSMIEERWR